MPDPTPEPTPDPTPHTPDTDHEVEFLDDLAGDGTTERDEDDERNGTEITDAGGSPTGDGTRRG